MFVVSLMIVTSLFVWYYWVGGGNVTNAMFAYMTKVKDVSDNEGRFEIADVTQSDNEIELLKTAKRKGWIRVKAYDCRITKAGMDAWWSEKDSRDEKADQRTKVTSDKTSVVLRKLMKWLIGAVGTAVIAEIVSKWFH